MRRITKKSEIDEELAHCFLAFEESERLFKEVFHDRILSAKVKFPLLEHGAAALFQTLPFDRHLAICDAIQNKGTIGGNVVTGKLLQLRLVDDYEASFDRAATYIAAGEVWYASDIIGERVFGNSLLMDTDKALAKFLAFSEAGSWVIRSFGTGCHFAGKRGLDRVNSRAVFDYLISKANAKDKQIKAGIGWGAKTLTRMHPDLVADFESDLNDAEKVKTWFRSKVQLGLKYSKYGKGN